jgi:hypothetical protein
MKTDGELRALVEDAVSLTSEAVQALTDEIAGRKLEWVFLHPARKAVWAQMN